MPTTRATKPVGFEGLAEHLRQQILTGQIQDGDRLPSFTELQTQFGAATSTINRALIALEQEGLIKRERRRGVFASSQNRNIPSTKGIIGVSGSAFLGHENIAYWSKLLHGITEAADEAGMQILLVATKPSTDWEKADGFLFCDWSGHCIRPLVPAGVPCVSLLTQLKGVPSVTADDFQGGHLATQHLLDLGHKRIAYMPGGRLGNKAAHANEVVTRREAGYVKALTDAGIKFNARWTRDLGGAYDKPQGPATSDEFVMSGHVTMEQWLRDGWDKLGCTAIFAHNDQVAIGIIEALKAHGLKVPQDVSVVGFDGAESYKYFHPSLTTVQLPLEAIGALAVKELLPQLQADTSGLKARHIESPVELKKGESTGKPGNH